MDADDTLTGAPKPLVATAQQNRPRGVNWGDMIDSQRAQQLERSMQNPPRGDLGPYAVPGVSLTGADVYWLAVRTLVAHDQITPDEAMKRLEQAKEDALLRVSLDFSQLDLRGARLAGAHLEGATMGAAHLNNAYLGGACLDDAFLDRADLTGANLRGAFLKRVSLRSARLNSAYLESALLHDALLSRADLIRARLINAQLIRVDLREASLQRANFIRASLEDVYMYEAHLEGALFTEATLIRCDFRRATLDSETRLNKVALNAPFLEQTRLRDTNLAVLDWKPIKTLSDETEAREPHKRIYSYRSGVYSYRYKNQKTGELEIITEHVKRGMRVRGFDKKRKSARQRAEDYRSAARAYRALSVALNDQGISRDAARFQYRSEVMRRKAAFHECKVGLWAVSGILDLLAGYGIHHIRRLFISYVIAILGFAALYYVFGQVWGPSLTIPNALLLSFTSFHGRGLAPSASLSDLMRYFAIGEALLGVVVEALLIAALVRLITGD